MEQVIITAKEFVDIYERVLSTPHWNGEEILRTDFIPWAKGMCEVTVCLTRRVSNED